MRYELFLRRTSEPLTSAELDALRQAAALERGELQVEPYRSEQGQLLGLDLGVELEQPGGAACLCSAAFEVAAAHRLSVYDPQLGRTVGQGDEELVQQRFDQGAAFDAAAPISSASDPGGGGLSPGLKLWLLVLGLIALVLLLGRWLRC